MEINEHVVWSFAELNRLMNSEEETDSHYKLKLMFLIRKSLYDGGVMLWTVFSFLRGEKSVGRVLTCRAEEEERQPSL